MVPSEAFIYLDSSGRMQNSDGIPILYHIPRDFPKKQIRFDTNNTLNTDYIYNTAIPELDIPAKSKKKIMV